MDTRILLNDLSKSIKLKVVQQNEHKNIIGEMLCSFVMENQLINFQLYKALQKATEYENQFIEFFMDGRESNDPINLQFEMSNIFLQNIRNLDNGLLALILFIDIYMKNKNEKLSNKLFNLYLDVIDKIKNADDSYHDLFGETEYTLKHLGYTFWSMEMWKQENLCFIVDEIQDILRAY